MLLEHKQIIGLPVETKSGERLGKIASFNLDSASQTIYQYQVNPLGLSNLFAKELLIHRHQVISLDDKKMIVDDLVSAKLASPKNVTAKNPLPAEAIASER